MGSGVVSGMRELRDWMSLFASIGHLSLAVTALVAGRRSSLARPLAALCFALFGWNFSTLAHHVFGGDAFNVFDAFFTCMSPPLVLEVVLTFIGASRRHLAPRIFAWTVFGALAAVALGGLASRAVLAWPDAPTFAVCFLLGWVPTLGFEVYVLGRHMAATSDPGEKARTRTVLAALAIGGAFSLADVARGLGLPLPYLGSLGTLVAAALLTTLAVRFELFDRNVSTRTAVYVLGLIVAFLVAYLVVLSAFAGSLAAQVFASAVVTLLALAAARELALARAELRARTQRLAVLGRFSAQMAHDIKGPLSALLGALQVVDGADDDPATRKEFLGLVADQARRISAIVDRYDRIGRVEPRKTLVRVNEVVRAVARAHGLPDDAAHLRLAAGDPECEADRELFESAVENVVRNAVEAADDNPSAVRVETEEDGAARSVVVRVVDEGRGMDPRTLERAVEDFFTTKTNGSGLGLAFARRVLLAHGGDLRLASERAVGTTVELRLPR